MVQVAIEVRHVHELFGGELGPVLEFIRTADRKGIDQVVIADHVVVCEAAPANYPGAKFPPLDYPWYEPVVALSVIAAQTQRIRLATGILISPLRPAVLLAKQLATLDLVSGGRLDIGFGAGWQREEFAACGVSFEGRFHRMDEQILACRALWGDVPASFRGDTVAFERMYCFPRPVQSPGIPIWLGISPTEAGFNRLAQLSDGWIRLDPDPKRLKTHIDHLRERVVAAGRPANAVRVRAQVPHVLDSKGQPNLAATLDQVPAYIESGAEILEFYPGRICTRADQLDRFLEAIVAIKTR